MFRFLSKNTFTSKGLLDGDSTTSTMSCFLHSPFLVAIARSISISTTTSSSTSNSFTVSYLMDSCGLSQQNAISLSKRIQLKDSSKPDSVLTHLRNYGFTNTHISKFVFRRPELLLYDPVKNLQPKFDFFSSLGFSGPDLTNLLSSNPGLLACSLHKTLIPVTQFLKSICHTSDVISVLKCLWVINPKYVAANVEVLRANGVPNSNISVFLKNQPTALCASADRFRVAVDKVKDMGFHPFKGMFLTGIRVLLGVSKSLWDEKVDAFRRWGWSDEEIRKAFLKQPSCMITSYNKINGIMDFLVSKMGYDASLIAQCPNLLLLSLEKRIIPRGTLLQVLISKGLVKHNCSIRTVFCQSEKYFLKNFVTKFEKQVPEQLKLYQGRLNGRQTSLT